MNTKIKNIIFIAAIIVFFFIISLVFDEQIVSAIQTARYKTSGAPAIDLFFSGILFLEKAFIFYPLILIIASALLAWKKKTAILPFIISTGIAALISFLLKMAVARPRPLTLIQDSFPSGHATVAFTPIPFLFKFFQKSLRWIPIAWLVFAVLLSFARLWFGLHYLSDLIAGAAIGAAVSYFIILFIKWRQN